MADTPGATRGVAWAANRSTRADALTIDIQPAGILYFVPSNPIIPASSPCSPPVPRHLGGQVKKLYQVLKQDVAVRPHSFLQRSDGKVGSSHHAHGTPAWLYCHAPRISTRASVGHPHSLLRFTSIAVTAWYTRIETSPAHPELPDILEVGRFSDRPNEHAVDV